MLLILFRRSHCRVPTGTPTKPVATAGWAYGQWHKRSHSFVFRLPPGVCKARATFTGTNGIPEFQFRSGFCQAVYIPWEGVIMITKMTTTYLQGRETDWDWGTLEFQTLPFKGGRAL